MAGFSGGGIVSPTKWLTPAEVRAVIEHNAIAIRRSRAKGRKQAPDRKQNYILFRLSLMGLRVGEIVGLNCGDFILSGPRPVILVRSETTKAVRTKKNGERTVIRRARKVPLYWDPSTADDIREYLDFRKEQIARMHAAGGKQILERAHRQGRDVGTSWTRPLGDWRTEPFVCSQSGPERPGSLHGNRMNVRSAQLKWDTIVRQALGEERASQLSIHCGRHTFITHCMATNRHVAEIRDAVGHRSLDILNRYTGVIESHCAPLYPGGAGGAPSYSVASIGTGGREEFLRIRPQLFGLLDEYAARENVTVQQAVEIALRLLLEGEHARFSISQHTLNRKLNGQLASLTQPLDLQAE